MGTNKVYAAIGNKIQVASIALMDINFAVSILVLEIHFFIASCKGKIVHIYADDISVKELSFHKSSATTSKLIQHQIALFRVSEQYVSWNIRRPVSTPLCIMRCPIATLWK